MSNEDIALITLHNAIVRRNGKDILSIDDFNLEQGESIALIGPNGAGKSTFINLITREVFPLYRDHPPVLFKGKSLVTLQEIKQCLGVVSATMQNQITVHLPVFEVVYGGLLGSLGVPRQYAMNEEGKAKVAKILEFLGIAHLADRDVMTLSSGQARRVLIARALVHDPEVLVLDEPTTGLDPEGMYYVRKTMRDLTEVGKAIILVTHYPEDIIPEIKRVVMIKDGKLFADKPKEEALTTACVSELFDVPLRILSQDGYYSLVTEYQFSYNAILHVQIAPQISWRDVRVWLKEHDWKSCVRQKRTWGSNPHLSARNFKAVRQNGFFHIRKTFNNEIM